MAALWGENHERTIRDAMWNNTVDWWKRFFLIVALSVVFTSPLWTWYFFMAGPKEAAHRERAYQERLGESNRARERQTEENTRQYFNTGGRR